MSTLIDKLTCEHIKALTPYESARRLFAQGDGQQQQIWLNANESPYASQYAIDCDRFNRYPDCQPEAVKKRYGEYTGVESEQILVTRGADEGIELLIRTFCRPSQDSILICPPTYGMYAISAQTCNIGIEKAPLNNDFSLNIPVIESFKGKVNLVFICSPNNPTGTTINSADIERLLLHFSDSALVVIDEAYVEFDWQSNWARRLQAFPNLVILRTLSKAFALAGLRCGFTLASSEIIEALLKVIAPYPVPEPVAQIAEQALSRQGQNTMEQNIAKIKEQTQRIKQSLKSYPSIQLVGDDKANFILFRCAQKNQLMAYLVAHNVFIRDQSKQLNLENCLRITVGNEQQNRLFLDLVKTFYDTQESAE